MERRLDGGVQVAGELRLRAQHGRRPDEAHADREHRARSVTEPPSRAGRLRLAGGRAGWIAPFSKRLWVVLMQTCWVATARRASELG
jgi:hypothetical protein